MTTPNRNNLIFGTVFFQAWDIPVDCLSTIMVGPTLFIDADDLVNNPCLFFNSTEDPDKMEHFGFAFTTELPMLHAGDRLKICCEKQNKSVTMYKLGSSEGINYLGAVTPDSSWPMLRPGENLFSYQAASGAAYIRLSWEYPLKFIGI